MFDYSLIVDPELPEDELRKNILYDDDCSELENTPHNDNKLNDDF